MEKHLELEEICHELKRLHNTLVSIEYSTHTSHDIECLRSSLEFVNDNLGNKVKQLTKLMEQSFERSEGVAV